MMLHKILNKHGSTNIVELLIVIPILIIVIFLPISFYQLSQQQNFIEDVKTQMVQEMSRNGELSSASITTKWIPEIEKISGVKVISITPVGKVYKKDKEPMKTVITLKLKPAFFSSFIGGEYKTKGVIYSEYVGE
ncbi:MAG: hypothetical protein RR620_08765 [Clostridium sp.]